MQNTHALEAVASDIETSPDILRWSFFRSLRTSNLLSPEDVDLLERETAHAELNDIQQMLLDQELLTPYQLKRIIDGKAAGLVLGQYRILDVLGGGGFGQVFKASHTVLDRVVALKLMTADYCRSRLLKDVFRRELAAVRRLNHPNIASTCDANIIDGTLFLAMEYVPGTTLDRFVRDNKNLSLAQVCSIMLQVCHGLQHAHENGVIHRDIKPDNILVARSGGSGDTQCISVKVIDFGLARLQPQGDQPTGTLLVEAGAIVGTPAFMSPEQAQDPHSADSRSDLYSLGCTFYYLLTGRFPFEGSSPRITLELHSVQNARPVRELRPEVPVGLAAIVARLMAKQPGDRYQSAAELIEALAGSVLSGLLRENDLPAAPPRHPSSRPVTTCAQALPTAPAAPVAPVTAPAAPAAPAVEIGPAPQQPPPPSVEPELRKLWADWRAVVVARATGQQPPVSAEEYKVLYRSLLAAIGAARGSSTVPAECLDAVRTTVEPWVTLQALAWLERHTLAELHRICLALDARLETPEVPDTRWALLPLVVTVLAVVAGALWWLVWRTDLVPPIARFMGT